MSRNIILTRVTNPSADPFIVAVARDYATPADAAVFAGAGLDPSERVVFWIGADGGGFGAIDTRPMEYARASDAAEAGDFSLMGQHGGVNEFEFEPGSFDPAAKRLVVPASLSLLP